MNYNNDFSVVMAERLKTLREKRGLSHERLSKAIKEKYGIEISSDSLMNYEVSDKNHTKFGKNRGMRVQYLHCLSDFYGVSSDYILGISDVKPSDITAQSVIEYIGLSDDTVKTLHDMRIDDAESMCECAEIGSNKPIRDFIDDVLDDFYADHRLISTFYIALRRNIANGGHWYSNNTNRKTDKCNTISPDFACMKIAREIELLLRRKYRVKPDGAAGGYNKEFISDFGNGYDCYKVVEE